MTDTTRNQKSDLAYLEQAEAHSDEGPLGEPAARSILAMALHWVRFAAQTPAAKWRNEGEEDPHGDRFNGERSTLCGGDITDDLLANMVYLDPSIHNLTAAKERIRWLSRKVVELAAAPASGAEQMREALDKLATQFEIKASEYTPGLQINKSNPHARKICDLFNAAAKQIRALPAPPAAGLDREAVAETETVARFKLLCETLRFASDKDVLMAVKKDDVEIAFRILALQPAQKSDRPASQSQSVASENSGANAANGLSDTAILIEDVGGGP